ncbi:MAG: SAM-dependent methyltransferase [Verrucomicrobia bacterium]|nr:SAM-dependent methyltransferase [Verrucomicrobiota bacterium]
MTDPVEQLVTAIRDSIDDQTFQKLTLGKFQNELATAQHVYVRMVDLKTGPHLSFVYRQPTEDITKNSPIPEGIEIITGWLGSSCRSATLLTSNSRQQLLFSRRGKPRLFSQDLPSLPAPDRSHDRKKVRLLRDERALELLGVVDSEGRPRAQMGDKYRQVHHFIEALAPILKGTSPGETLHIVDMGCGKGYLTFALHQFLRENGLRPATVGVEKRGVLVKSANSIAGQLEDDSIRFIEGEINDVDVKPIDILIALHACDTATDHAIYRGIQEECRWIVVSPCCQHELRPQLAAPAGLEPLFRHGVQVDRMTETVTDTLRCLYLEAWGYQTRIQEFVGTKHTAKNLLIVASRTGKSGPRQDLVERAIEFQHRFGVQNQRLQTLLTA